MEKQGLTLAAQAAFLFLIDPVHNPRLANLRPKRQAPVPDPPILVPLTHIATEATSHKIVHFAAATLGLWHHMIKRWRST